MRALAAGLGVSLLVSGCGEDSPAAPPANAPDGGADAGGGTGCAPGERPLEGGGCQPAGVPSDGCGVGFEWNDLGGCDAIMPERPCGPGLVALPGETSCHELSPCGAGPWAVDLPDEPNTQYVDGSFTGTSDGSEAAPWKTVQEGIDAAAEGALVAIAAGTYDRAAIAGKSVRLWGRCPGQVELSATDPTHAALELFTGAGGSLVRGLALGGAGWGTYVSGALDVTIERVWIHDTGAYGIYTDDTDGPASVAVSTSLVEAVGMLGIFVEGVAATIEDTSVRSTQASSTGTLGNGVVVLRGRSSGAAASATITHCVLDDNRVSSVLIAGAEVDVDSTLVRNTNEHLASSNFGQGVEITNDDEWIEPSQVTIRRSVIEDNHDEGVIVTASDVTIDATVVRRTKPNVSDDTFGRGIGVSPGPAGRPRLTVQSSLIHDNHDAGIMVSSADLVVDSTIVLETRPNAAVGDGGFGIFVQKGSGDRSDATIRWSVVRSNRDIGVTVVGSDAEILGSVIESTQPRMSDGTFGRGIQLQLDLDDNDRSLASIASTLVADNYEGGVMVFGADLTLDASWVRGTRARESNQEYGDGLLVAGLYTAKTHGDGTLRVGNSWIEDNARTGIASFSGGVQVSGTVLDCNPIALNKEDFLGAPANFDDLGGNVCGCDGTTTPCKVLSSNLTAPDDLP